MDTTCTCHCDDTCYVHNTLRPLTHKELGEFWKQMIEAQTNDSDEIDLVEGRFDHSEEYWEIYDMVQCFEHWEDAASFQRENEMNKF
jgi:hypothetical protein